jgi:VIT1/CCC1 family predicted Fe2+/Mn2+ transporter
MEFNLLVESWKQEKNSAYLYRVISRCSSNSNHKKLFQKLAEEAECQAKEWEQEIKKNKKKISLEYFPSLRTRIVAGLIPMIGSQTLRLILSAMKVRGMSLYSDIEAEHPMPKDINDVGRHHQSLKSGNNLRAAVFGINDGLVSNASLVMGMAGGQVNTKTIILAGMAGLFAGAFSMAAGEYVSVRSQREMYEYQINLEKKELELYPKQEAQELALIYEARGLSKSMSEKIAEMMMQNPQHALNTLAREELGLNPDDLVSPYGAAISSFFAFVIGAAVPLIPFFIFTQRSAIPSSIISTGIFLFIVGAILSLYSGRSAIRSGFRVLSIGVIAGSITYFIGHLFGVALG